MTRAELKEHARRIALLRGWKPSVRRGILYDEYICRQGRQVTARTSYQEVRPC